MQAWVKFQTKEEEGGSKRSTSREKVFGYDPAST